MPVAPGSLQQRLGRPPGRQARVAGARNTGLRNQGPREGQKLARRGSEPHASEGEDGLPLGRQALTTPGRRQGSGSRKKGRAPKHPAARLILTSPAIRVAELIIATSGCSAAPCEDYRREARPDQASARSGRRSRRRACRLDSAQARQGSEGCSTAWMAQQGWTGPSSSDRHDGSPQYRQGPAAGIASVIADAFSLPA